MEQTNSSNLRYFKAKEEDKQEISMTNVITTKEMIRISIDQVVEIGEFHMDRIIEVDQGMNKAIAMTLEEETLRGNLRVYKKPRILEDRIIEVDKEETIEMKIMKEVGVGLEKGNIRVI